MALRSYEQFCALARALDHVGHRWTLLIVRELLLGPKRFTDLRDGLPGIANNLLADRLRQLQADGIVAAAPLPSPAVGTAYVLTDSGRELTDAIHALIRWGGRWMFSGPGEDAFRPGWLALALDALGIGGHLDEETPIDLIIDGEAVSLMISGGRVAPRRPEDPPLFTVEAAAGDVLGLAAGALRPDDALQRITLRPDNTTTRATFARLMTTSRTGSA